MSHKRLLMLKARVCQNKVRLSFYKGTQFFQSEDGKRLENVVRIYRKPEPDFVFGQDYDEYFDGLNWQEADMIFKGMLPAINRRKFEYVDDGVEHARAAITDLTTRALISEYQERHYQGMVALMNALTSR